MAGDDEVEVTRMSGVTANRDLPHTRFHCVVNPFPRDNPTKEICSLICSKCYCYVCDIPAAGCKVWATDHCFADDSVTWVAKRAKKKRITAAANEAAQQGRVPATREEANRRFAEVSAAEARQRQSDEEANQNNQDHAIEDEDTEETFSTYEPFHFKRGQPHPDPVVETTSLSYAELPPINYTLSLPSGIFDPTSKTNLYGGSLSNLQLETIAYACQRHETMLPSGHRAGFFLGDGVGLGKGRQLAGIIAENWLRGRKRSLWVSVSADLMEDAKRDLRDIGFSHIPVWNITKLPYGKLSKRNGDVGDGVLFSTYAALVSKRQGSAQTRADQMVEWLGGAQAEGCILFDEAHKAKNLIPEKAATNGSGPPKKSKSSQTAIICQKTQNDCPLARVVYCSATGASSLQNMAYMERLGLWGQETAFNDFQAFDKAISDGGVGAMELIALDLKRRGMYICRQLSFKAATFNTQTIDLTQRQTKMYDQASAFWSEMLGCFNYACYEVLHMDEQKGHPSSRVLSHYWGCHQRFFRAMCMAMKVPSVCEMAKQALAENKCVVIGLQTTGESRVNDAVKSGENLDEFAGMKEVVRFLLKRFPTGDYTGQYPESDYDEAGSDSDEDDELAAAVVGATSRVNQARRRSRRGGGSDGEYNSEEDEDEDDTLDGFIVGDHVEESDSGSEYESDVDDVELEGDAEERKARAIKLPKIIKNMPKAQLRELLRTAQVPDQQCTDRPQLMVRLKQIERQSRQGSGLSVAQLIAKAGLDGKGKRASPEGASSTATATSASQGRPKRLRRGNVQYAGLDSDAEDEEEEQDVVNLEDEEMTEAEPNNGLIGKRLQIKEGRTKRICKVVDYDTRSNRHTIKYEDNGVQATLSLKNFSWNIHNERGAPGANPERQGARRAVESSDEEDLLEKAMSENAPPQKTSAAKRGKAKKGHRRINPDDSDSASEWAGSDDEQEEERSARKPRVPKMASASQRSLPKKPAPKRRKSRAGSDDDDDDEVEEEKDLSAYNHPNPAEIKQLQRLKKQLFRKLHQLQMPDNPLDKIIHELGGPDHVAELTGRKGRLVRNVHGKTVYAKRNDGEFDGDTGRQVCMEKINLQEKSSFMQGKKLVAIISEAASSGISLQADRRVANTRKRVHITLELPWSADQCIQQCGRTHRSNQVQGPEYQLMMTACGGERRFASTVAKRLQALGALTKGDRRAADAADLSAFDVDTKYGKKAMDDLIETLQNPILSAGRPPTSDVRQALGFRADQLQEKWSSYLDEAEEAMAGAGIDKNCPGVKKFLNRLLGMPVQMQNKIFTHFMAMLEEKVKRAKESQEYDEGVVDVRGESVDVAPGFPVEMVRDTVSGVPLLRYKLCVDRGLSFHRAKELLDETAKENGGARPNEGFYISRRAILGREKENIKMMTLIIQKPISSLLINAIPTFRIFRPNTGLSTSMGFEEFAGGHPPRHTRLTPQDAEAHWKRHYDESKSRCMHGPNCKAGMKCTVGKRQQEKHVLAGAVLPFWGQIKDSMGWSKGRVSSDGSHQLVKKMRIVRVRCKTPDGKELRLVGIEVDVKSIARLDDDLNGRKPDAKPDIKPKKGPGAGRSSDTAGPSSHAAPAGGAFGAPFGAAASSADVKPQVGVRVGSRVRIFGLQSEAGKKFNGKVGHVRSWMPNAPPAGRWVVKVPSELDTQSIQEKNLTLM